MFGKKKDSLDDIRQRVQAQNQAYHNLYNDDGRKQVVREENAGRRQSVKESKEKPDGDRSKKR